MNIPPDNAVEVSKAVSLLARMRDSLRSMQIYSRTWNADDLLAWTTLLLNPNRMFTGQQDEIDPVWDETKFLSEQMIETRTSIKVLDSGSGLRFGNRAAGIA